MDLLNSFLNECAQESVELEIKDTRTILRDLEHGFCCDEPIRHDSNDTVSWIIYMIPGHDEWRIMKHLVEDVSNPLEDMGVSIKNETWISFPADLHTKFL